MEISIEELNTLLEKEFERGRHSITYYSITTPQKLDYTVTCDNNNCTIGNGISQQRDELSFTC